METLQRTANRGSVSTGYDIDNSCKFEEDNTELLWKKFSGEGTGTGKTFTISGWVKRTELGGIDIFMGVGRDVGGDANDGAVRFNSDQFQFVNFASNAYNVRTNAVFRDTSAWYHIMVAVDTTQGTDSNRVKLYVNGEQQTSLTGTAYPTQNYQFKWGRAEEHMVGARPDSDATAGEPQANQLWSGYMADVYFVDGLQLAPTDFGEADEDTGIWKPIKASPTFGTNGFYLNFADASDLGDDESGNGNDFAEVNLTAVDQATDTPTNNFATWNTLVGNGAAAFAYVDGATKWKPTSGNWQTTTATIGFTKGKWYAEFKMDNDVTAGMVGLQELEKTTNYVGGHLGVSTNSTSMGLGYYNADGKIYKSAGSSSYGASYPSSVLVGVAIEYKDDGVLNLYVAKDNVWQNSADPANSTGGFAANSGSAVDGFFTFASSLYQTPGYWQANFGGYTVNSISSAASDANGYGTFEYAPPSGYYALCTKNLAEFG